MPVVHYEFNTGALKAIPVVVIELEATAHQRDAITGVRQLQTELDDVTLDSPDRFHLS